MATRAIHRYRHVRISREARTRLLTDQTPQHKGDVDGGKYYKCWNCGQICNDKRHALAGANSGHGITYRDYSRQSAGIIPGNSYTAMSLLRRVQWSMVSARLNSDGNAKTVVHSYRTTMNGCPLCGSLNWRGDY